MVLPVATVERYIGGGKLYFTEIGGTEIEIGAVQNFAYSLSPETVKAMDKSGCMTVTASVIAKSISGTVTFMTENVIKENLRLALFGTQELKSFAVGAELPDGTTATVATSIPLVKAGKKPVIVGKLRFVGAGCEGKTPVYIFYKVSLTPNGEVTLMDSFTQLSFTGEILADVTGGAINYFDAYLLG